MSSCPKWTLDMACDYSWSRQQITDRRSAPLLRQIAFGGPPEKPGWLRISLGPAHPLVWESEEVLLIAAYDDRSIAFFMPTSRDVVS
jgi:hypothetical protein